MSCGCGCNVGALDDATRALIGAKAYGCGPTMGDILPTVVWPSDVDRLKASLDPTWKSTKGTVDSCTTIGADVRAAFTGDFDQWSAFAARPTPLFGSANEWDLALSWQAKLHDWQEKLKATCALASPVVTPPKSNEEATSAIKWIAGAVIVGGAAYLLAPIVRSYFR